MDIEGGATAALSAYLGQNNIEDARVLHIRHIMATICVRCVRLRSRTININNIIAQWCTISKWTGCMLWPLLRAIIGIITINGRNDYFMCVCTTCFVRDVRLTSTYGEQRQINNRQIFNVNV